MMLAQKNRIILVNEKDEWQGTMEKMQAHKEGALHRAFSVFVLNEKNEMLLQRRALHKYHSPGLWSNTCCSHPMPGESTMAAAHRRLQEEMGFDCNLTAAFDFRYRSPVGNGLIENEYDHIYIGSYSEAININIEEVSEYTYMPLAEVAEKIEREPDTFTTWFRLVMPRFINHLKQNVQLA
jgi:isopentenyl-diphosphate Delta-isomerase